MVTLQLLYFLASKFLLYCTVKNQKTILNKLPQWASFLFSTKNSEKIGANNLYWAVFNAPKNITYTQ